MESVHIFCREARGEGRPWLEELAAVSSGHSLRLPTLSPYLTTAYTFLGETTLQLAILLLALRLLTLSLLDNCTNEATQLQKHSARRNRYILASRARSFANENKVVKGRLSLLCMTSNGPDQSYVRAIV